MRGWKDDASGLEQRLKDLETIARSLRRRWWLVGLGLALGLTGWAFGVVRTRPGTIVLVGGGGLVLNALLGIINERGWYRWWLIYGLALLDVLLVGVLVVWFGHGGFAVAFLIAVLPYAFDQGHTVGNFLVLTAALAYLGASYLHDALYGGAGGQTAAGLETVGLITVAWALKQIPATLIRRIRDARDVMGEAEQGQLAVRAPAEESDELGFLEKSFNRMLGEIGATISTVQREADEVAAFAEQLAASAEELHATSETVTHTAQHLARDLAQQRELAEGARGESAKAADQAESLRVRAELMQVDAARLVAAAQRGRERVARASQTLRAVGDEVRATASTVAGLSGMSERIGGFAQTIARIARQTHLLALNAAIEAARAEEHGEGFAVVADEVRSLAGEAGKSAREVAELVSELRAGIDAAARAMQSGEAKVRDIGAVAAEADSALQELHQGIELVGDLVDATAEVSRGQAQRLAELAQSLQQVAAISSGSSQSADGAAAATQAQITSMGDLTATSQQLAQLAERLRASIARFSVLRRDPAPREHPSTRAAADRSPRPGHASRVGSLVPHPRVEGVKRVQGIPVRGDQQVDVARERDVERETPAELAGGDAQHRFQVPAEALRRRVVEPVGHIGDGQAGVEEQIGGVQQPHAGEIGLGRREADPVKARHQRAGADAEVTGQAAHRAEDRGEARQRLEEHPHLLGRVVERGHDARQDARRYGRGGVGEQVAQPAPAGSLGAIDRGPDAGGAEPQQCFRDVVVMA